MDFHTLTRKALQALCKQNGIPANITNVAMADSLSALHHVEGLEELLNQSPEKITVSVCRTAAKTTARRKAVNEEPESSQPLPHTARHATTKKTVVEEVDQEKTEVPPKTPAAPATRRRAPAASTRQKTETLTETTSVQCAYSTRRSVRLLGKTMAKMGLEDDTMSSSINELSGDTMDCSEQSQSSVVKRSDMQTVSEVSSKGIDVSEVESELKSNDECSVEKESHSEGAEEIVSVKDSDDVTAAQSALPQEVNEPPSAVKTVEPVLSTLNSTPTKSPASKISDVNVAATVIEPKEAPKAETLDDYSGKIDFESDSSTEGESEGETVAEASNELQDNKKDIIMEAAEEEASEDESSEDETVAEASNELQENKKNIMEASEEEASDDESSEDDSVDKASSELQANMDDIREVTEEEDSDDESTEGEYSEEESLDIGSLESSEEDENVCFEFSEDETVAKKQSAQKSLIVPTSSPLPNLATQFPRPTEAKSSGKKLPEIAMYNSDGNEESVDASTGINKDEEDLEEVEMKKKDEVIVAKKDLVKEFEAKSLRQLKKMLKTKLKIADSNHSEVLEKPRIALSEVPENQMAVKQN